MSPSDASTVTNRPLPLGVARALCRDLEAAGYEASDALTLDDEGRRVAWVYVTQPE